MTPRDRLATALYAGEIEKVERLGPRKFRIFARAKSPLESVEGAGSLRKTGNTWAIDQSATPLDASQKIKNLEGEVASLQEALRYSGPDEDRAAMSEKISQKKKRIMFEKVLKNPRVL